MSDIDSSSHSERGYREKIKSEIDSKRYVIGLRTAGKDSKREREREYSIESDTLLFDHLVMREFVSGPPSYRSIHKKVGDRKVSLRESSCLQI